MNSAVSDTEQKLIKQQENLTKLKKFLQDLKLKKEVAAANEDFMTAADCKKKIKSIEDAIPMTESKIMDLTQLLEKQKMNYSTLKQVSLKKKLNELYQLKLEAVNHEDFQLAAKLKNQIQDLEKQLSE